LVTVANGCGWPAGVGDAGADAALAGRGDAAAEVAGGGGVKVAQPASANAAASHGRTERESERCMTAVVWARDGG
jgi:hypothetical protein